MVGKPPHRPAGKARTDNEHMKATWSEAGLPHQAPSASEVHQQDLENMGETQPAQYMAEEQIGGSRPGVPSLVKEAIARREAGDQ